MEYKTIILEDLSSSNLTKQINEKLKEMSKQGYEFIDLSFLSTQRVSMIFKKI